MRDECSLTYQANCDFYLPSSYSEVQRSEYSFEAMSWPWSHCVYASVLYGYTEDYSADWATVDQLPSLIFFHLYLNTRTKLVFKVQLACFIYLVLNLHTIGDLRREHGNRAHQFNFSLIFHETLWIRVMKTRQPALREFRDFILVWVFK